MMSCKLEHLAMNGSRRDHGPLDGDTVDNQWHVWDLKIARRDGQRIDPGLEGHERQQGAPVWLRGCGDNEPVDGPPRPLRRLSALAQADKLASAQLQSLGFLRFRARNGDDAAAELGSKLDSQVAQPADTEDADRLVGPDVVQRREHGRAGALQRRGDLV